MLNETNKPTSGSPFLMPALYSGSNASNGTRSNDNTKNGQPRIPFIVSEEKQRKNLKKYS